MQDQLLTRGQVAERLGIKPDTLDHWRYAGSGPAYVRVNARLIRYRASAVEAWLASREVQPS